MMFDSTVEFCDAVAVGTTAGTALIGNVVDMALLGNLDANPELYLVITVDTAIATGGAAGTIQFKLASDTTSTISTTTSVLHVQTQAFVTDDSPVIPAGQVLYVGQLPSGLVGWSGDETQYRRYLGILSIIATTTITAGKINAFLTTEAGKWTALARNSN